MRRGPKPAKSKDAEPPVARKSPKDDGARVRDLEKRLAEAQEQLQTRKREFAESQEQQAATAEILRVISRSPADLQPAFDAIVASAVRLCNGVHGAILRVNGNEINHVAQFGHESAVVDEIRRHFPRPLDDAGPSSAPVRAIRERRVVEVTDTETTPGVPDFIREAARRQGFRSELWVPMVCGEEAIGTIVVTRREPGRFSEKQVALLRTFADQAVIAIENVRLFRELQTRNRDLTEALDRQTATSEILRVISRSQTDVQPVFDTIVSSAVRLCRAYIGAVFQFDGEKLHLVAHYNFSPETLDVMGRLYPKPPQRDTVSGRAIQSRAVVQIEDVLADREFHQDLARTTGWRSMVAVPMLREGHPIGAIVINRIEPGPFSDNQIELLKTFADQAAIAIENVRLFKELEARTAALTRSVEQLTALGEVGRAVSSTLDLETVLTTIVSRAVQLSGLDGGVIFEYDELTQEFVQRAAIEQAVILAEARRTTPIRKGEGVVGRTAVTLRPEQVPDITAPGAYEGRLRETLIASGVRAVLAVPMVREGRLIGCLAVTRNTPGDFQPEMMELLRTFATQSSLAIQNARLFREIEEKSRQLEVASQHKSEFLANMSHELRTPLNAIIGFSEVLTERMFGDLNEKQEEYLKDIYASGTHLLSLINDILDLSKIEAGRMELELSDFDLPTAVDNALMLVRERAGRRSIALHTNIDNRLGQIEADERKVRQVVLNLLSNAIKFTPEGGRIEVSATPKDGLVEVSVSDTGVGIAPEDQEAVFEEFRQVGTADKKVEGTGLGLTLCRKFVELHGGRIWVKSDLGVGSTFTFTIPVRPSE